MSAGDSGAPRPSKTVCVLGYAAGPCHGLVSHWGVRIAWPGSPLNGRMDRPSESVACVPSLPRGLVCGMTMPVMRKDDPSEYSAAYKDCLRYGCMKESSQPSSCTACVDTELSSDTSLGNWLKKDARGDEEGAPTAATRLLFAEVVVEDAAAGKGLADGEEVGEGDVATSAGATALALVDRLLVEIALLGRGRGRRVLRSWSSSSSEEETRGGGPVLWLNMGVQDDDPDAASMPVDVRSVSSSLDESLLLSDCQTLRSSSETISEGNAAVVFVPLVSLTFDPRPLPFPVALPLVRATPSPAFVPERAPLRFSTPYR
mmetsp:Transcript_5798/g.18890  ORF Transcript_5798/g.18890 Transcript_5798/m.18890 type:complete len:316 (+) Transcript_5798:2365-3312(+)